MSTTTNSGLSTTDCVQDSDCITGTTCQNNFCTDSNGFREQDRIVQSCVSPKHTTTGQDNFYAGCGTSDGDTILECHRWWIEPQGMEWRHYLQYNPFGKGDAYCWAYDEAVCGREGNTRKDHAYPWCTDQHDTGSAINSEGVLIDNTCPCTVDNPVAPLGANSFVGWGVNMHLHVYDVMWPGYTPPTTPNEFSPVNIPDNDNEQDKFFIKVVNQFESEILVYMDVPPCRYGEMVNQMKWEGFRGPAKSMRGVESFFEPLNEDQWSTESRITIAENSDPTNIQVPQARVNGAGKPIGGFYVPPGWHLKIHIANSDDAANGIRSGWFGPHYMQTEAIRDGGTSIWITHGEAYNYPDRDPLLLAEQNVNTMPAPYDDFTKTTVWINLSAVDGINANMQVIYGNINRVIGTPLFESSDPKAQ